MTVSILAIELGKYKSVACVCRPGCEPAFRAVESDPDRLLRLVRQAAWVVRMKKPPPVVASPSPNQRNNSPRWGQSKDTVAELRRQHTTPLRFID